MAGIGHNSGQVIEPGFAWRKHVWTKARANLLPTLPIEVVRTRVRRAAELGLPYKTYAGIRASTGHDLVGFLFSSNALRLIKAGQELPAPIVQKLNQLHDANLQAVVHRPLNPTEIAKCQPIHGAHQAPVFTSSWAAMRDHMVDITRRIGVPADRFVLVGETAFEREWAVAARSAGFISGDTYFGASAVRA